MGRLPNGRVVHVEVATDGADHHLAGVEPDADLERHAVGPADPSAYARIAPASERRVAGPHRVILVGQRRAEERHDPVAHDLVDRALVAVDRLHHPLEDRVEELARLLGVPVGEQLHRALEVGEEHRDLLALALQGGLRGQDLLGEVLGRVALGRSESGRRPARRWPARRPHRGRTCAPGAVGAALGQTSARRAPHSSAESRAVGVLGLAPGTRHGRGGPPPP